MVTRWWNHFKSTGRFRRPFVGVEVANLHEADLNFLLKFITRFHGISTAVVVTKVEEDSPAYRSGLRINDVILNLQNKLVESKIKFYETLWDNTEKVVPLILVRMADGAGITVSLMIEETTQNKFHEWPHPRWDWAK